MISLFKKYKIWIYILFIITIIISVAFHIYKEGINNNQVKVESNLSQELSKLIQNDIDKDMKSGCIIKVFSTWCPYCHQEFDYFVEISKKYGDIPIYGILYRDTVENFNNLNKPKIFKKLDDSLSVEDIRSIFELNSIPVTIVMKNNKSILEIKSSLDDDLYRNKLIPALNSISNIVAK